MYTVRCVSSSHPLLNCSTPCLIYLFCPSRCFFVFLLVLQFCHHYYYYYYVVRTARIMLREALKPNPKFLVYFNFEGWMLSNLTAGMSPVSNLGDALAQVTLSSFFRFISLFYLNDWWNTIHKYHSQKKNTMDANTADDKDKLATAASSTSSSSSSSEEEHEDEGKDTTTTTTR